MHMKYLYASKSQFIRLKASLLRRPVSRLFSCFYTAHPQTFPESHLQCVLVTESFTLSDGADSIFSIGLSTAFCHF